LIRMLPKQRRWSLDPRRRLSKPPHWTNGLKFSRRWMIDLMHHLEFLNLRVLKEGSIIHERRSITIYIVNKIDHLLISHFLEGVLQDRLHFWCVATNTCDLATKVSETRIIQLLDHAECH